MDIGRTIPASVALAQALLLLSSDGIAVLDADTSVTNWNPAAARFSGIGAPEAIGLFARDLVENADALLDVPADGRPHRREAVVVNGGVRRRLRASVLGLGPLNEIDGWIVSFSPQRRYAEIEQLKNEFVGAISHELKTPLATIKAFAEVLRKDGLDSDRADTFLATIDEQTERLARMIDELLSISRVAPEQLLTRRVTVAVDEVVNAALEIVAASGSHPIVERELGDVAVSGDPALIAQALAQLIDNAVKFSPTKSPILISAERHDDYSSIAVRDCGIGIDDEHLPYIFDQFYRVDRSLDSPVGGIGVGLFIANSLVRAHGGSIVVATTSGHGSTFTLSFPVRA